MQKLEKLILTTIMIFMMNPEIYCQEQTEYYFNDSNIVFTIQLIILINEWKMTKDKKFIKRLSSFLLCYVYLLYYRFWSRQMNFFNIFLIYDQ